MRQVEGYLYLRKNKNNMITMSFWNLNEISSLFFNLESMWKLLSSLARYLEFMINN